MKVQRISIWTAAIAAAAMLTTIVGPPTLRGSAQLAKPEFVGSVDKTIARSKTSTAPSDDPFVGDKLSPDVRELVSKGNSRQRVCTILQVEDIHDHEFRRFLKLSGVRLVSEAKNLNMLEAEVAIGMIERIAAHTGTLHISRNLQTKTLGHVETTTGVAAMRALSGNSGIDGRGIGIAIGAIRRQGSLEPIARKPQALLSGEMPLRSVGQDSEVEPRTRSFRSTAFRSAVLRSRGRTEC